jgi:hypothetical protein
MDKKRSWILAVLLLFAATAIAQQTIGRVAHPQGTAHSRTWSEPRYYFTAIDGDLPEGMTATVDSGIVTITNPGTIPGAHSIDLTVTFDWLPFPAWGWPRIPISRTVNILWGVYAPPDEPFFDGFGDDLIVPGP